MDAGLISREEFNLFLRQQNGSLKRIEDRLCRLETKLDALVTADNERVTIATFNEQVERCNAEFERLRYRLSPAMAALIAFLSSACAASVTLILSKLI